MDSVKVLATHAVSCKYEDLDQETIELVKKTYLDTLGTIIAGATGPGCKNIIDKYKYWGGREESTVFIYGGKIPAPNAAMVNAVMARALDFDESMDNGIHVSASIIPVALAMAEKVGSVSGEEFIATLAVAADIVGRIDAATNKYHGFDPTLIGTVFGTTVVAGRFLKLSQEEMENALGLAFNESSGSFQSNIDGVLSVRFNQGLSAQAGVVCAEFAKEGITGVKNVFDGIYGYFNLISRGQQLSEHLTKDLGEKFYINRSTLKRFPSCGATLTASDAMLYLKEKYDIQEPDVKEVVIKSGTFANNLVGGPFKIGSTPVVDAQFSVIYAVANILLRGYPSLYHFQEDQIIAEDIFATIKKVKFLHEPEDVKFNETPLHLASEVTVYMHDGHIYKHYVPQWKGHLLNPISMDEIIDKFYRNMEFAKGWFNTELAAEILNHVLQLESNEDITNVVDLLSNKMLMQKEG